MTVTRKEMSEAVLDYVSRLSRPWWGQMSIMAAFVVPDFAYLLATKRMIADSDITDYLLANTFFLQDALRHGQSIFWDPHTFSGFPTFISLGEFFSLSNLFLTRHFGFVISYHVLLLVFLTLIGFLVARTLIELGVSSRAAMIGGLSFMISTKTIDLPLLRGYVFLPALCLIAILIAKRKYPLRWLVPLGGLVTGSAMLTTHYNLLIVVLTGVLFFSLFLPRLYGKVDSGAMWKTFGAYAIAAAIGISIGLLRFLPLLSFISFSSQSGGMSYAQAARGAIMPADFLSFVFPKIDIPFLTRAPVLYLGILPAVFLFRSFLLKDRMPKFLMAVFAGCLLMSIKWSPLFWLLQKLPVLNYFRSPSRWMLLGVFAACLLVGFGAEAFLSEGHRKFKEILQAAFKWTLGSLLALGTATTVFVSWFGATTLDWLKEYFDSHLYAKTTGLPLAHYHQVIEQYFHRLTSNFSFSNVAFLTSLILIGLGYALLRRFRVAGNIDARFLPASILIVGVNYVAVHHLFFSTMSKDFFAYRPPIAAFITEHPGRTLSFLPRFSEYTKVDVAQKYDTEARFRFRSEILNPRFNEFYGIDSTDGYDSLMPSDYSRVLAMVGSDRVVTSDSLASQDTSIEEKIAAFGRHRSLLDMLGTRYVVSTYDLSRADLHLVTSATDASYGVPIYLFENMSALPPVYLAAGVTFTEADAPMDAERLLRNDFHRNTFIECAGCQAGMSAGSLEVLARDNDRLQVRVDSESGSWLIFNESNLPGWRVVIDGQGSEIHRANSLFQAAYVPAGRHEVEFRFLYIATLLGT